MTQSPQQRVRVTGPTRRTPARRPRTSDIDDQTPLGTVLMGSLLRAQLRLAFATLAPLAVLALGLPLAFHLWPGLTGIRFLGAPLPWLVLGLLIYPFLVLLGWLHVRAAERNERAFAELVSTGSANQAGSGDEPGGQP